MVLQRPERTRQLVAGDYLLTINPVDGSEATGCPTGQRPVPERLPAGGRAEVARAAQPAPLAGFSGTNLPLLGRDEERERLVRLLATGRSARLIGASGSGRTTLLDAVARGCANLAPDGVIRLTGYQRTPADLLYGLFAAVYHAPGFRPDRPLLLELLSDIGAVVVIDDLEFGGAALEEVLASAPECAFLLSATPDVAAPAPESGVEDVTLPGLARPICQKLVEAVFGRPLDHEEAAWVADLWFESEGLPLRFVQAGALLRQRAAQAAEIAAQDPAQPELPPPNPLLPQPFFSDGPDPVYLPAPDPEQALDSWVPLPPLAESAAPAARLAMRLSPAAQETLRFAVALGGECPDQAHLPALVDETNADTALGEIVACGLATPVGAHYRLAAGVRAKLAETQESGDQARTVAEHFTWWSGHPSVPPERVAAEADALLAALTACRDFGPAGVGVRLARSASPALAAALHWSAWERALRMGQECARLAGEVAEEAYFHHELGVLALCTGNLDRARAELEASIALRAALSDRQGSIVGRRTLALVMDRLRALASAERKAIGPGAGSAPVPAAPHRRVGNLPTAITRRLSAIGPRRMGGLGSHRGVIAAGAGAVIAAVVGTTVVLGNTGETDGQQAPPTRPSPTSPDSLDDMVPDVPTVNDSAPSASGSSSPSSTPSASTSGSTSPSPSADNSTSPSSTAGTPHPTHTKTKQPTKPPTHSPTTSPTPSPTDPTTEPTAPTTEPGTSSFTITEPSSPSPESTTPSP